MSKKLWIGFIVVFIIWTMLNMITHSAILGTAYQSEEMMKVWRPDMMSKMWIFNLVCFIQSFFFVLIFSKWYKGRGIMEGIQYGIYFGFPTSVGMAYGSYASYPIPYSIAVQWFLYGIIHFIILGIVIALILGKKQVETPTV